MCVFPYMYTMYALGENICLQKLSILQDTFLLLLVKIRY